MRGQSSAGAPSATQSCIPSDVHEPMIPLYASAIGTVCAVAALACGSAARTSAPKSASTAAPAPPAPLALQQDPLLRKLHFAPLSIDGVQGWLARDVVQTDTLAAWKAARGLRQTTNLQPIVVPVESTEVSAGHSLPALPPFDEEAFRATRRKLLAPVPSSAKLLGELPTAAPWDEPYEEKREFDPVAGVKQHLVLVLLPERPWEIVRHFAPDGVELAPRNAELSGMLRVWNDRWGAEAIFVDGYFMELQVERTPTTTEELRALALDFHLTCPSNREAYGVEPAGRLMVRLRAPHWVCWWFVE